MIEKNEITKMLLKISKTCFHTKGNFSKNKGKEICIPLRTPTPTTRKIEITIKKVVNSLAQVNVGIKFKGLDIVPKIVNRIPKLNRVTVIVIIILSIIFSIIYIAHKYFLLSNDKITKKALKYKNVFKRLKDLIFKT